MSAQNSYIALHHSPFLGFHVTNFLTALSTCLFSCYSDVWSILWSSMFAHVTALCVLTMDLTVSSFFSLLRTPSHTESTYFKIWYLPGYFSSINQYEDKRRLVTYGLELIIYYDDISDNRQKYHATIFSEHHADHNTDTPCIYVVDLTETLLFIIKMRWNAWCFRSYFCTVKLSRTEGNLVKWDKF